MAAYFIVCAAKLPGIFIEEELCMPKRRKKQFSRSERRL
jgi:hypothetical protein